MSSVSQYVNLFVENREAIESHSSGVLNTMRDLALKSLEGKRLPERGDEGFAKTSIEKMFEPDFGVNINRINIPVDVARSFRCDVPNVSTLLGVVVNDSFVPTSTLLNNLPEGVLVMSLSKAAQDYPALVGEYYGSVARVDRTAVALNTLLAQDGVFIYVPSGVRLANPVQIVSIFNSSVPMMGVRRILIVAEGGSDVNVLLCDHTQVAGVEFLSSEVIEVCVGENAHVDVYSIEESSAKTSRYSQLFARQADGSRLRVSSSTLQNGTTRNDFTIDVKGEGCETVLSGMVTADGKMHVDNCSSVNHLSPRSVSTQLFKYLLDGESQGAFEGGIYVSPEAPYTGSYQSNRNILASESARMHTTPQLLIYNDEVKCSHGATTGQLDRNALFYMQTRGVPKPTARQLLMQAFMTDALEMIAVEGIRSRLSMLVERRLSGDVSLCGECSRDCHKID